MTGRQRRRSRGLAAILFLVAWLCAAAGLANPSRAEGVLIVFVAGMVTGAALMYHYSPRPARRSPPAGGRVQAAASPAAATPRPGSAPPAGPGPRLQAVPPAGPNHPDAQAALRATLAARADQVSSYVPKPPNDGEGPS